MLSTTDNPYSPFTQWEQWDAFDCQTGHYTCAYLARIIGDYPEIHQESAIIDAMALIVETAPLQNYEIVLERDFVQDSERQKRFK
jgi:hypothetical protein